MSLPSRGVWIEIIVHKKQRGKKYVAPLPGSVDRNVYGPDGRDVVQVAPLAGSVDRNTIPATGWKTDNSRSPCGERG